MVIRRRYVSAAILCVAIIPGMVFPGLSQAERATISEQTPVTTIAAYQPNPQLEGRLAISGSDTMKPLLRRLAGDFTAQHPRVKLAIEGGGGGGSKEFEGSGSTQGIREFVMGISSQRRGDKARGTGHEGAAKVTVLASSRQLSDEERKHFVSHFGYEPIPFPVAMDAVAIYVHQSNPVASLSLDQLAGIFGEEASAQRIETWGQAGVKDLADQPIHLYGRDKRSGTRDFFVDMALHGHRMKGSITEKPGSASEVLAISQDPLGIGYAGIGFNRSDVRIVPLQDAGGSIVPPSLQAVTTESYPLSRTLWLYINQEPNTKYDPVLLEFLRYVNSPRGQAMVATAQAYPLPESVVAKNHALLNGASVTAMRSRP